MTFKKGALNPNFGRHISDEMREKLRRANLGKHHTFETIEKIRQSKLGSFNPNFETHLSNETRKKISQAGLGRHHTPETIERIRRTQSTPEAKERCRQVNLGKCCSPEVREKIRLANSTVESIEKHRERSKRLFEDPEYLRKMANGLQSKTKPEKYIERILQALYPNEFKYNGQFDCGITIDRLTPDFVNVNGKKQVIDVHGSYYHKGEDVNERMARYAKYGYSSLIVWEHELKNEKAVVQRIVEFVGKPPNLYFDAQGGGLVGR